MNERINEISDQLSRVADELNGIRSLLSVVVAAIEDPVHPEVESAERTIDEIICDIPPVLRSPSEVVPLPLTGFGFTYTPEFYSEVSSELAKVNNDTIDRVLDEHKRELELQVKNGFRPQLQEDMNNELP